jgi:hypothetical protein
VYHAEAVRASGGRLVFPESGPLRFGAGFPRFNSRSFFFRAVPRHAFLLTLSLGKVYHLLSCCPDAEELTGTFKKGPQIFKRIKAVLPGRFNRRVHPISG